MFRNICEYFVFFLQVRWQRVHRSPSEPGYSSSWEVKQYVHLNVSIMHRVMYYIECKTPHPPFWGLFCQHQSLLSAVLATNACLHYSTVVLNTADRGSDVSQKSPKLMTRGGGGCLGPLCSTLLYGILSEKTVSCRCRWLQTCRLLRKFYIVLRQTILSHTG